MGIVLDTYWLRISPHPAGTIDAGDGKWVVFLRPTQRLGRSGPFDLARRLERLVTRDNLKGALLTRAHNDMAVFFTSGDAEDIWRVKQVIQGELSVSPADLIWKTNSETDADWEAPSGRLLLLSKLINAYERHSSYLKQGRRAKADRVEPELDQLITKLRRRMLEDAVTSRHTMIVTPVFSPIEYTFEPLQLFVLMPFTEPWSDDVYHLIKEVGTASGLHVVRADDIFDPTIIINDIWKMINSSGLLIADISVHNPNVFYELGIAHTLGKKVVLIKAEGGGRSPFDIGFWRYLEYGLTPLKAQEFSNTLRRVFDNHAAQFMHSP